MAIPQVRYSSVLLFVLFALLTAAVRGEVTASSDQGFISEHQLRLPASPALVYKALTEDIHRWWDASHSYSLDASNFRLEARAGGCFCERLPSGGEVEHMRVVFVDPGKTLRLSGGLGPLQEIGAGGAMTFSLSANDDGSTELVYRYVVNGFLPDGLQAWAEPVDQVQLGQLQGLQNYLADTTNKQ